MIYNELQEEIYTLLSPFNVGADEISKDFDFSKGVGAYFIIDGISNDDYKEDYPLEIQIISIRNHKFKAQALASQIDKAIDEYDNLRIVRQNAFSNSFFDEENKFNLILQYWIRYVR